jgi:hypothetical protein
MWLQSLSIVLNFELGNTVRGGMYSCVYLFWCLDLYHFTREITWSHKVNASEHARKKAHTHTRARARTHTHTRARAHTHTHTHTCARTHAHNTHSCLLQNFGISVLRKAVVEVNRGFFFLFSLHFPLHWKSVSQNFKEGQLLDMMLQRDRKLVQRCLFDWYKSLVKRLLEMLKWLAYGLIVILHW